MAPDGVKQVISVECIGDGGDFGKRRFSSVHAREDNGAVEAGYGRGLDRQQ
jgi:hypothetical protein